MSKKIGIVTVLFNSQAVLEDFFVSLEKQSYRNFILYVVDNKSSDNSLELVCRLKDDALFRTEVIANEDNYGVAKGNNIGITKAINDGCELVLLSNNDVVFEADTINNLVIGMESHAASMAVPKIYLYGSDIIWCAGGHFSKRSGQNIHRGYGLVDEGKYSIDEHITFAPTCFMLISKDVFDRVGFMDENYFVYWDDTDFVYRAVTHNESLWYIPESVVQHKEAVSTGNMSDFSIFYQCRNFTYFALKNYSRPYVIYVIAFNIAYFIYRHIFRLPFSKMILGISSYLKGLNYFRRNGRD